MTFKDVRQGQMVYLLHKDGVLRAEAVKVKMTGMPRFPEYGTGGNALGMVVDLSVEAALAAAVGNGGAQGGVGQGNGWAQGGAALTEGVGNALARGGACAVGDGGARGEAQGGAQGGTRTAGVRTYVVPADSAVASAGNVVISVDKDGVLREVGALESESEDAIAAVEGHRKRVESCRRIKAEWDERFAEKREQDERIGSLEGKVDGLASLLKGFIKEMKGG